MPINFFVIIIMDLDDADDETIEKYKNKEMFKGHWLEPYIIPIWNNKNLDEVLFSVGILPKIPNDKEKGRMYSKIFPINKGETDKEAVETLYEKLKPNSNTNMSLFMKKCLEILEETES